MIKKVLVANRGEIAMRIMRSCREMGLLSVAVYSEADRTSMHVRYADEAYFIGPSPSSQSYLKIDKIIDVAKKSGADAIHPGYGFLSENAEFSKICKAEGIIFIGPDEYAINIMGDKIRSRKMMIEHGVNVVPGAKGKIESDADAVNIVKEIGLPVMIKAAAGGGGKGMRLIKNESEIISAVRAAKSEAKASFGNEDVYIERYISSPHHIEFQILADKFGNTIQLFERECSVQRRHQKVLEETPSPLMTPELRKEMGEQAIMAAKSVDYAGAGTVEFLVDDDRNFYFLEMNTRLQVEHPITERVVGVDLVKAQIRIAQGEKLWLKQSDLRQYGHAIEVRIYAEDPDNNFMPNPGLIKHITEPLGLGVRHDGYVYEGFEIPMEYDPMISKLIVWGLNREEAIDRMKRALYAYKITGVKNNIKFLAKIIQAKDFVSGNYNTHFIEDNIDFLKEDIEVPEIYEDIAAITSFLDYYSKLNPNEGNGKDCPEIESEWKSFGKRRGLIRF
jgi:acetyl-CoA carboxylase biotin carboxylase subunit